MEITEPLIPKGITLPVRYNEQNDSVDDSRGRVVAVCSFSNEQQKRAIGRENGNFICKLMNGDLGVVRDRVIPNLFHVNRIEYPKPSEKENKPVKVR